MADKDLKSGGEKLPNPPGTSDRPIPSPSTTGTSKEGK